MTAYNVISRDKLVNLQREDISIVTANLDRISAVINGLLDNDNFAAGAAIAISKLAGYPADGTKLLYGDGSWA